MINKERLVDEFIRLAAMESPSRHEGVIASYLKSVLKELGAHVVEDGAAEATAGDSGNLLGKLVGNRRAAPAMALNAHMDTVAPGRKIHPVIRDGVVYSGGDTILGADDKSGLAIILEVVRTLIEHNLPHGNLELLFTVCEEVGLIGAKSFDVSVLEAKVGYSLDSMKVGSLVIAAPAANHIEFTIHGRESHAGVAPEDGINAIKIAGLALARMPLGRIDEETTANIGLIQGGTATNIIPGSVVLKGEARSHCMDKLRRQTERMVACVVDAVEEVKGAGVDVEILPDFPLMCIDHKGLSVELAQRAAEKLGRTLYLTVGGGGSDANVFNEKGIEMAIMPTGMTAVHTNAEHIRIDDMVQTAELLLQTVMENCP